MLYLVACRRVCRDAADWGVLPMTKRFHVASRHIGVGNFLGLHRRVSDKFVRSAHAFQAEIGVQGKGIVANCKGILGLMCLGAECGTCLILEARGFDAEDAVAALSNLILAQSGESQDQGGEARSSSLNSILPRIAH
jgi:phosphocarrier protein